MTKSMSLRSFPTDKIDSGQSNLSRLAAAEEKMKRLLALLDSYRSFSSTLDIDQVLLRVLSAVEQLILPERCSIWRVDEESQELRFMVMLGDDPEVIKVLRDVRMKVGEGAVGWTAKEGVALNIPDVQNDVRWSKKVDDASGFITRSLLCVPLNIKDRTIGVVCLINKHNERPFDNEDQFILESLSAQVAIAMDNAMLYQKVQQYNIDLKQKVDALEEQIAERKRAEEERQVVEDQLRQAQKIESIGSLAGGIAHDFNNLLTPIIGYTGIAQMRLEDPERIKSSLAQILKAAERAQGLTRQILAFSRKQVLDVKVINLNDLICGFEKMLRRLIRADIEIITDLLPLLGNIKADPSQVEQILLNLVVNARDAMEEGGLLTVKTTKFDFDDEFIRCNAGAVEGQYIMLSVTDTGCGMDEETKRRIFEPFFTTKSRSQGTGLGLATVYGIIKQHGGYITVDTALGKGTCFSIYFPEVEEKKHLERQETPFEEREACGAETILLVEDDPVVRGLAKEILDDFGYTILDAESAEVALDLAHQHEGKINLLLTDVIMPKVNGKDLHLKLKQFSPETKTLFMTGYPDDVIASLGVLDKGIQCLLKPFSLKTLTKKVREVLDN